MAKRKNEGDETVTDAAHYEEWRIERKQTRVDEEKVKVSYEKLKLLRKCVKISEKEAEVWNTSITRGGDGILTVYLLPDEDIADYSYTYKPSK